MKQNMWKYRKIPKISPGAYIFQRPFLRGLFLEGLILILEGLIYGGKFASQNRRGFFALPVWGAYTWRGLFSEFYGNSVHVDASVCCSACIFLTFKKF